MQIKCIDKEHQIEFCNLSKDFNPLHFDEDYARNSMFQKQVVHGIHQLFIALEDFSSYLQKAYFITRIDTKFENTLGVNEPFYIERTVNGNNVSYKIKTKNNDLLTNISFSYIEREKIENRYDKEFNYKEHPLEPKTFNLQNVTEKLFYSSSDFKKMFKFSEQFLSPVNTGVFFATTRIVGMNYPGLNSVYNSLSLNFETESNIYDEICYDVSDRHIAMNLLTLNIKSDFVKGKIKAFVRPQPPEPRNTTELGKIVNKQFANGQRALVVGASRGIGLQCLKILALGGAETLGTYYNNSAKVESIVNELNECGLKTEYVPLDITNINNDVIGKIKGFNPTHIYYFATPKITNNTTALEASVFSKFSNYYIFALDKFLKTINFEGNLFVPSTTAIDELPKGMLEYALSKQAAELYFKLLEKFSKIKCCNPRFPRIETVQTMNLLNAKGCAPEDVLIKELLAFTQQSAISNQQSAKLYNSEEYLHCTEGNIMHNKRFHHIGIATKSIEKELKYYKTLGYSECSDIFTDEIQKIKGLFISADGQPTLELLENLTPDGPLNSALKSGTKMYHIAYEVEDIETSLKKYLATNRAIVVVPITKATFFEKICFIMLPNMMLIEFVQKIK